MITSAHSKSFNSPGFNPIMQKFYQIICEIIVTKTVCVTFLIFCRSSFISNFLVKNSFSEPKNQRKLNISRPIYFQIIQHNNLQVLSVQITWKDFFFRNIFSSRTWSFFNYCSTTNLGVIFFHFLQGWLFDLNIILKTWFQNLFRKTEKMAILLFQISHRNPTSYLKLFTFMAWYSSLQFFFFCKCQGKKIYAANLIEALKFSFTSWFLFSEMFF